MDSARGRSVICDAVLKGALAGLMAGCLHTLAGPDHLAGLTPLTLGRGPLASGALGSLWGLGHGSGQLALGLVMILANERFHRFAPVLEQWGSVIVGAMLLGVGCMGFWEMWTEHEHSHGHQPEVAAPCLNTAPAGTPPRFAYNALTGKENGDAPAASSQAKKERRGLLKTFAVGIVYGLQPDALFVIVPALTLPSRSVAAAYVAAFVGGTVLAMGGYAMLLGLASTSLAARVPDLNRYLSIAASSTAIAVALYILAPSLGIVLPF
ncbi:hypothetical protein H632_c589p0 [Helicosporidium sp. ATCC 50920]|nr:hypothetical protein H632_c589p0 [Helicosporidium sp. ATCC 50920]|eukprot:KDD75617.1 hypothetical protein H632_c589p0 [Helicosporidium sp. ATCC 50920]